MDGGLCRCLACGRRRTTDSPQGSPAEDSDLRIRKSDASSSFLRAARGGNLDKVLDYIKNGTDINTCNQNGLNALHLASKEGHGHIVSELLSRGANVDAVTKKGNSALHVASLAGQEEIVRLLVQAGANVNAQSQNGFTPLYMAAQENHDAVVRYLLANGANQSIATEDGFTPLAVALQQGHDKVVAVLLENDTRGKVRLPALHIAAKKDDCKSAVLLLQNDHKSDVTSKSGFTPLHIAAHYGNQNIASLLLDKGADINYMAKHHITPLHVAAKWGKANMVTLLCERGANQEAKTRDGLTPLHCGARSGHENVVDLLLEKGAFISAKTKNGLTPLHMAAQGDHVDAARILFYHKAPVDDVTVDYLTALHVAAHCGHVKVAKLLLDRHADANSRALNGFTPLHIACKKNRIEVVELLLKYGASIEATTESGLTPLHVASFMGCMNIVIYLLQHDAKPNHATVRGETPLHLAARANQADIIRILLRNRAEVDARAREQQTPLHIAARLGNADIVMLLLQHGAAVDSTTKDLYTALHIAAKEGQDEVAQVLMEHGASLSAVTKKGFTPLHLAAKYGNMRVAKTLLAKDAPVDAQGKNGVTPLHVAAHYDHQNVALLLLEKGASVKATAKNGYTPLHIAAKKNQMDIATTLLEYGAETNCESKAGFTPLHLAAQEGHSDMSTLLIEHMADVNQKAKNGLTPLHLCAQEDRVPVAAILVKHGAEVGPETAAGYTPLHVASHFGQLNMVRFLLQHQAEVNPVTAAGYTPLHQAAQQGHTLIISLLLEHKAQPNAVTNTGQTALSIAQRLGYISVVESLKVVTETVITTTTTTVTEEKYKVVSPETMQETFLSDSEDEGGDDFLDSAVYGRPSNAQHVYLPYYEGQMELSPEDQPAGDSTYKYLTVDEMKSLGDDSMPMDVSRDEFFDRSHDFHTDWISPAPPVEETISPQKIKESYAQFTGSFAPDNVDISRSPVTAGAGDPAASAPAAVKSTNPPLPRMLPARPKLKWKSFLVSFMVDARGGAMRGCRHSGVRVIVPPRKAAQPMRITCRYLKKDKLLHPPPLMEGEAIASRILEMGPAQAKFLGPVIIEVPHFASLRGREREIVILRSDNGETWKEHTLEASEEAVQEVLNESFDGDELKQLEDLNTSRITRIVTTDFPQYFAIVSRLRQEVHAIGTEGGMVSSTVVPQVQAVFQPGALTKKIKVGLQAQPIPPELVAKLLGNRVAVSPIVTIEPRRRKFHKPITLTIPVPQAAAKGMINQYSGDAPTLRLLCSITGGTTRAQWEDVTGSTPLTFVNDCVSFTTTVSARFWLMDCRNVTEATAMATELYKEAIHVPFMAKFVVFAKRHDPLEGRVRVFCMTDDKEEKTLEQQEHFVEVAKSRDVEVLEGKPLYLEFAGNLLPVTKSGDQLNFNFYSFRENRMPFNMRVKDHTQEPMGRVAFMREKKLSRQDAPQPPICNLNIQLPADICPEADVSADSELLRQRLTPLTVRSIGRLVRPEIHRADIRITDIAHKLGKDWVALAPHLDIPESDIQLIQTEYPDDSAQQATVMLRLWMNSAGHDATGNTLARGLQAIHRDDIVTACITDSVMVTDAMEAAMAKARLDQSGFDSLREELGPSRDTSFRPDLTLDDRDIMKEAESVEDVRVSEVGKTEPVITPPGDADERKYAAEEKTVSSAPEPVPEPVPAAPRPSRPVAPIAPKDGPATGQVTVTDLASPVEQEREIAPVKLEHPEVAEREEKRRSMVLRELGDALAEVERTQPPLERPGREPTDEPVVEEPVMVSEKKGLKSPVTPAMSVPTAAVRTHTAPGVSEAPRELPRAPTPPSTPTELEPPQPDGSKTTVMQQTSDTVTEDGRLVQKSTTITTTSVGETSDLVERLTSEGDLQKSEAAQSVEEKDVSADGAPVASAPPQVVWQPLTTSELEMTSPLPPDAADWLPLTTSEMTSQLPPDAANWPPLTITEEWPVTSLAGGPRGPRWALLAVADRDLLPVDLAGDLGDLGLSGDLGDLGSLPRHSDDTATAVPTSAPPVQKPLPVDVTADLTGNVTASVSPLSEFADAAAGPAGWDSSDTEGETAPDISLTELPAGTELDQDQCRLISVARQLADVAEGLRRLSLTEEPEQDWASPEREVGRDPLVGEESGGTALGEDRDLFQAGRISSQRENMVPSVREVDGSVRRSAAAFGGPLSLASGPSPPGSPLGDASWGRGGLSVGPPTLSGSEESLGPHIQRTDSTEEEDQGPVCAQVRLVVRTRSPGCEAVEIRSIRQFVSGEPGRFERAVRAGSAAARSPSAGSFESQRCVTRAEVAARSAEAQRPDDLGLMATLQGEGRGKTRYSEDRGRRRGRCARVGFP
ncbi:ankyrin-3-like [Amphibalanus amphitrite]|uniref:ankyrin-3-like n=1 Tax=Amphibalanus amphitrite TaxID=1232801 RepID=UPI001C8FCD0C|nr:ankyrin-3-like [Amphibalanus amphitrite]